MVFLGRTACACRNTLDYTLTNVSHINYVLLQDGIFNDLFISRNADFPFENKTLSEWDYDTILSAHFNGNLHGGNVEYSAGQVSHIRIKRRKKGSYQWLTLYEIPMKTYRDFLFERFDCLASGNKLEYEYAFVPVMNNVEGNINLRSVISDFEGIFVIGKNQTFGTQLDAKLLNISKEKMHTILRPLGCRFPIAVSNGEGNNYSGSFEGTFIESDETTCEWKVADSFNYRFDLNEFLNDGQPKFLKSSDGRTWLIKLTSPISESENGHYQNIKTTFDWIEVGDYESGMDLYNNNLIGVY